MEVILEFNKLLEKLRDNASVISSLDKTQLAVISEIKDNIQRISFNPSPLTPLQQNKLEQNMLDNTRIIYKALKIAIDDMCILHTTTMNDDISKENIMDFLNVFAYSVFQCSGFSVISKDTKAAGFLKSIEDRELEEADHKVIIEELGASLADKHIGMLNREKSPTTSNFLNQNDHTHVVYLYQNVKNPLFLIFHYPKPNPFFNYYTGSEYQSNFDEVFSFIYDLIDAINEGKYIENRDNFLSKLDLMKLTIARIYKKYFFYYLSEQLKPFLEAEINLIKKEEESPSKRAKRVLKVDINEDLGKIELRPGFDWDTSKLNSELTRIWAKFTGIIRKIKSSLYYRLQVLDLVQQDVLIVEFDKNGNLVYQSGPLISTFQHICEFTNYIHAPKARNYYQVFSKSKKFLTLIEENLKKPSEVFNNRFNVEGIFFDLIFRKDLTKGDNGEKSEGFTIVFNKGSGNTTDEDERSKKRYIAVNKKESRRRVISEMSIFGENAEMEKIYDSCVYLFLPDDMASSRNEREYKRTTSITKKTSDDKITLKELSVETTWNPKFEKGSSFNPKRNFTKEFFIPSENDNELFENWSFDITKVENPHERLRVCWAMLNDYNLIAEYKVDLDALANFLVRLRHKYEKNKNPFHNWEHGVTVMHATYNLLKRSPHTDPLLRFGLLISAVSHDVAHTGRNNLWEVNRQTKLAIRYHDKSVLEQHHAATMFKILSEKKYNILHNLKADDYKKIRRDMIYNIMCTDMKEHVDLMKNFKELDKKIKGSGEEYTWNADETRLYTGMLLHVADLCGPTKEFSIAFEWSTRVNKEFHAQYLEEQKFGIPPTPWFKDLDKKHVMCKEEIAFISFMIKPLWETFNDFSNGACDLMVKNLEKNVEQWKKLKADADAELAAEQANQQASEKKDESQKK